MYRLVCQSGPEPLELHIAQGPVSVGRSADNGLQVNDPSVSGHHCEIEVQDGTVLLRDLGSTNGSFVNNKPVRQSLVHPGDCIRLGNIRFVLLADNPQAAVANVVASVQATDQGFNYSGGAALEEEVLAPPPPFVMPGGGSAGDPLLDKPLFCKNHYQNLALYFCPKCRRHFCDLCVNTRGSTGGGLKFCKICGTGCSRLVIKPVVRHLDFFAESRAAFNYPFRGDGWALLLGGTMFFGFLDLANTIARNSVTYGMRAMMMRVVVFTFMLGTGYLFSFLKRIIACTAQGEDKMPDWPELTEWKEDIVSPMFQFSVICFFSFGPALVTYLAMDYLFDVDYPWLVWAVALAGCLYFPMAFLGVAMFDTLAATNPLFVVGSIAVVAREYIFPALVFAGILGFRWLSETLLTMLLGIPFIPALISDLLGITLLLVEARILGLLYFTQKQKLGWFKR